MIPQTSETPTPAFAALKQEWIGFNDRAHIPIKMRKRTTEWNMGKILRDRVSYFYKSDSMPMYSLADEMAKHNINPVLVEKMKDLAEVLNNFPDCYLSTMPDEVMYQIVSYLPLNSRIRECSKLFAGFLLDPTLLADRIKYATHPISSYLLDKLLKACAPQVRHLDYTVLGRGRENSEFDKNMLLCTNLQSLTVRTSNCSDFLGQLRTITTTLTELNVVATSDRPYNENFKNAIRTNYARITSFFFIVAPVDDWGRIAPLQKLMNAGMSLRFYATLSDKVKGELTSNADVICSLMSAGMHLEPFLKQPDNVRSFIISNHKNIISLLQQGLSFPHFLRFPQEVRQLIATEAGVLISSKYMITFTWDAISALTPDDLKKMLSKATHVQNWDFYGLDFPDLCQLPTAMRDQFYSHPNAVTGFLKKDITLDQIKVIPKTILDQFLVNYRQVCELLSAGLSWEGIIKLPEETRKVFFGVCDLPLSFLARNGIMIAKLIELSPKTLEVVLERYSQICDLIKAGMTFDEICSLPEPIRNLFLAQTDQVCELLRSGLTWKEIVELPEETKKVLLLTRGSCSEIVKRGGKLSLLLQLEPLKLQIVLDNCDGVLESLDAAMPFDEICKWYVEMEQSK